MRTEDRDTVTGLITQDQCFKWNKSTCLPYKYEYKSAFSFDSRPLYDIISRKVGDITFSQYDGEYSNARSMGVLLYKK